MRGAKETRFRFEKPGVLERYLFDDENCPWVIGITVSMMIKR